MPDPIVLFGEPGMLTLGTSILGDLMDDLLRDTRFALRQILRRPRTSVLVVICATLAIGLNASVFTLVNAVTLREPFVQQSEHLTRLYGTYPGFTLASLSYPNYSDLRDLNRASESPAFSDLAAYSVLPANISIDGHHERLPTVVASGNYFSTLGVSAALGRVIGPADDEIRSGHPVAVIGDRFWRSRFGADPAVIGKKILINSEPFTVIGVTPPRWQGTFPGMILDLWIPLQMQPLLQPARTDVLDSRGYGWLMTAARLSDGIGIEQAQSRLDVSVAAIQEQYPDQNENWGVDVHAGVSPLPPDVQQAIQLSSWAMLGLVGAVLLIACANVAGLLLARAEERQKEIGIRLAIGAGRMRLVRQLLVESVTLASIGGVLGTLLALSATHVFASQAPLIGGMPVVVDTEPDLAVFLFSLGLTLVTGLLFGLLPALQATRPDLVPVLKGERGTSSIGKTKIPVRRLLVAFQVAVSMMLLITAGLFLGSLENERSVDLGFQSDGLLLAAMDPSLHGYDSESGLAFLDRVQQKVEALPGVTQVAWGEIAPLTLFSSQQQSIDVKGYTPAEGERMNPEYNVVSEGYFETLGIPVLRGRGFRLHDNADGAPVVVINQALADRFWADGQALGGSMWVSGAQREVIGIVANGKYLSRRETPKPHVYLSIRQAWEPQQQIHVRTAGSPTALDPLVRSIIAELDPQVAVYNVRTMDQHLDASLMPARTGAKLVSLFGGLALVLAAIGLFGLLSHAVARRTHEIGIRMTLGAAAGDIFRHLLSRGLTLVFAGLVLGLAAGLAVGKALSGILYGMSGAEPSIVLKVGALLLVTAFVAVAVPARRATRVDPMTALRHD